MCLDASIIAYAMPSLSDAVQLNSFDLFDHVLAEDVVHIVCASIIHHEEATLDIPLCLGVAPEIAG